MSGFINVFRFNVFKVLGFKDVLSHQKIHCDTEVFRMQHLRIGDQNGTFLFRIHASARKRQKKPAAKCSRFVTNPKQKSPLVLT